MSHSVPCTQRLTLFPAFIPQYISDMQTWLLYCSGGMTKPASHHQSSDVVDMDPEEKYLKYWPFTVFRVSDILEQILSAKKNHLIQGFLVSVHLRPFPIVQPTRCSGFCCTKAALPLSLYLCIPDDASHSPNIIKPSNSWRRPTTLTDTLYGHVVMLLTVPANFSGDF